MIISIRQACAAEQWRRAEIMKTQSQKSGVEQARVRALDMSQGR
jgi:hypothetical protein